MGTTAPKKGWFRLRAPASARRAVGGADLTSTTEPLALTIPTRKRLRPDGVPDYGTARETADLGNTDTSRVMGHHRGPTPNGRSHGRLT